MIDLYFWPTPNGLKIPLILEELGLEYKINRINIGKGEQFAPEYLKISPNNKIPALVDHKPAGGGESVAVFESGAILIYLAEKAGKFLPKTPAERAHTLQWLFWQVGGLGPMAGQANHFLHYAPEKVEYGIDRYTKETGRLYGVLDKELSKHAFVAGDEYTIADMAIYPWALIAEKQNVNFNDFPHVKKWLETVKQRPATIRAYEKGNAGHEQKPLTDEEKKILFGQSHKK